MNVTLTKLRQLAAERGYDDVTVERYSTLEPLPWMCTVYKTFRNQANAFVVCVAGTSRDRVIRAAYAAMKELGRTK